MNQKSRRKGIPSDSLRSENALAALLRHRRARPNFLDAAGMAARGLLATLEEARERNNRFEGEEERSAQRSQGARRASRIAAAKRFRTNSGILEELINLIHKAGSDPNIIRKIEAMEEE